MVFDYRQEYERPEDRSVGNPRERMPGLHVRVVPRHLSQPEVGQPFPRCAAEHPGALSGWWWYDRLIHTPACVQILPLTLSFGIGKVDALNPKHEALHLKR